MRSRPPTFFLIFVSLVRFLRQRHFRLVLAYGSSRSVRLVRSRRKWSASTRAIIASAIGTARMPTQGSWRPLVAILAGRPWTSIVSCSIGIDDGGLSAGGVTISAPLGG